MKNFGYIELEDISSYDVRNEEYCYGHLTEEEFLENCRHQGVIIPSTWKLSHLFGRFIPESPGSAYDLRFLVEDKSKRGNFPITKMEK